MRLLNFANYTFKQSVNPFNREILSTADAGKRGDFTNDPESLVNNFYNWWDKINNDRKSPSVRGSTDNPENIFPKNWSNGRVINIHHKLPYSGEWAQQ